MDVTKKIILKNLKWLVLCVCAAGFLLIAVNVLRKTDMKIDIFVYGFISDYVMSDFATPIVKFVTNFGGPIFLILTAAVLFIIIRNKKTGLAIVLNLGISSLFNQLLKLIFRRPRPNGFRIIEESGFSFPSGHSMVSAAFYGFLIFLIYKNVKNKCAKWILILFLGMLIAVVGTSRIYLGVHYASDVLGGFLISISYLIVYTNTVYKFLLKSRRSKK